MQECIFKPKPFTKKVKGLNKSLSLPAGYHLKITKRMIITKDVVVEQVGTLSGNENFVVVKVNMSFWATAKSNVTSVRSAIFDESVNEDDFLNQLNLMTKRESMSMKN